MMELIILGGMGRAGTNTVAQYLHLHPKIFFTISGAQAAIDHYADFDWFFHFLEPQIARFPNGHFLSFFEDKNRKEKPSSIKKYPFVGIKLEEIELVPEYLEILEGYGVHIYFVFCMRQDFTQLYLSRKENRQEGSVEEFIHKISKSFAGMESISKEYPCCCLDVTSKYASKDYLNMNKMLGIEPTALQSWWIVKNPKTNGRPSQDLGEREHLIIPKSILDRYEKMYFDIRKVIT